MVTAALESLSAPAGAEDTRTREQRYHDALAEAMRRLVASDLLPERAGQPVKAVVHVSLAELRALDDSELEDQWAAKMRVRWAARRAAASEGGSDGAAWLDGDAAQAATCDAAETPVVTGDVDLNVIDDLVRLCVQLDRLEHSAAKAAGNDTPNPDSPVVSSSSPASPSRDALVQDIIGKAADLLSGPAGLASFLRTRQLGAPLAGPSLPLDIGYSKTIPPGIQRGHPARPAVPVARRLPPARCGLPGPPRQAQSQRRPHQPQGLPPSALLSPPDRHPQVAGRWS